MAARFDSIELVVTDMAATLDFYGGLGLPIPEGVAGEGHVAVDLPGGLRIQFDTEETMQSFSDWTPPPRGGGHRVALAFECDSPEDVDAVFAQLVEAGAPSHLEPMDAFWGQRYASVLDPNGNPVDLFAALEDTAPQV
jgi:catechol 2,3-dioxygenase-like lactoylglutathione lyase family enzyme